MTERENTEPFSFEELLRNQITAKKSVLCIGVDPSPELLQRYSLFYSEDTNAAKPQQNHLDKTSAASADVSDRCAEIHELGVVWLQRFVSTLFEATHEYACAFKPNLAFFELYEYSGISSLKWLLSACSARNIPTILDGKRGDIGSTSDAYATHLFDVLGASAITVFGYMGSDSLKSFDRKGRGVFVVCKSSNPGSQDMQLLNVSKDTHPYVHRPDGNPVEPLYLHLARMVRDIRSPDSPATSPKTSPRVSPRNPPGGTGACCSWGLVMGATDTTAIRLVRTQCPKSWFLCPGVGAQGGNLEETLEAGRIKGDSCVGLIIPISRGITKEFNMQQNAKIYHEIIKNAMKRSGRCIN